VATAAKTEGEPRAGKEQRGPGQEPHCRPGSGQGWVPQVRGNPDDQKDRERAQPYPASQASEVRRPREPVAIGGHLFDGTAATAAKAVGPGSTVHGSGRSQGRSTHGQGREHHTQGQEDDQWADVGAATEPTASLPYRQYIGPSHRDDAAPAYGSNASAQG
jgi:hypothetical protein